MQTVKTKAERSPNAKKAAQISDKAEQPPPEKEGAFYKAGKRSFGKYDSGLTDVSSNTKKYLEGFGE